MIKRLISVLATVALLSASYMSAQAQNPTPTAPDNTGINVRDRDPAAMTAGEQSASKSDLKLTRQIRKAVMADKSLSMTKNVKIISSGGNVILRGPVKSAEEKNAIGDKATAIAGADKVNNQLEIAGD